MVSASPAVTAAPLTRAESEDVLRYWLAALRLEEALQARPQARRSPSEPEPVRLDAPTPGQEYFKLPLNRTLGGLIAEDTPLRQRFDGELARFFETWLHTQYRRSADDGELTHLLCFPVVHLPRGELAGLLRLGVRVAFGKHDGASFRVPTWSERQRGQYPAAPDEAQVQSLPRPEGQWPFFVDTRLLRHPLGVSSESIDALFDALRDRELVSPELMLALVIATLESTATPAPCEDPRQLTVLATNLARCSTEELLTRLTVAIRTLLQGANSRAQVYPVGVVVDGNQAKTTWHLQRELNTLLDAEKDLSVASESALGAYLMGKPLSFGEDLQRALYDGPPLTQQQRKVAQQFWGSRLSSVQGPPGTGKTTVILHLCAEALLRQVEPLVDDLPILDAPFVVTSSNNRAVDNVVDPLTQRPGLPLALRVGNRQICETVLAAQLGRTLSFLAEAEREPVSTRSDGLGRAVSELKQVRAQLDQRLAPRREAQRKRAEHARLSAALAELTRLATGQEDTADIPLRASHSQALLDAIGPLEQRFTALSKLCEATPGLLQVNAVARHYGRTAGRELTVFEASLASANLTLELPLPPLVNSMSVSAMMEAWEEGTEQCLTRLSELRERLERLRASGTVRRELVSVRKQLEALGPAPDTLPDVPEYVDLSHALFHAAVSLREAWAKVHAPALRDAVEAALRVVNEERSLRPLFRSDPKAATLLRRLFGIWGSTLLSLGNCFPPEPGSLAHVVIDEAGQCHPAHAVSALLRAESALVMGDVHQLSPVVELQPDDELRLYQACRLRTPPERLRPYRIHSEAHASAQTLADRAVVERGHLIDHFRCQPEIIAVSDALCGYGLTVHTPRTSRAEQVPLLRHPLLLQDLRGEQERLGGSLCNELELHHTLELVQTLLRAGCDPTDLAVITPYRGQLERLRRGFAEQRVPTEYSPELSEDATGPARRSEGVALGTVHRFQGGERSIVLFSSVITRPANLTFLNARPNLLNVAISRAQHHFICLGHREVLAQGAKTRLLVQAARALEA